LTPPASASTIAAYARIKRAMEDAMAKGEQKGNREAKKPKSDKPKSSGSAYKQSQGKGGQSLNPPGKKS
jgi:hypothetical protein